MALLEPLPPGGFLERIMLRQRLPGILIGARLVDQIPGQKRDIPKAPHEREDVAVL